jgi:Na+-transporting methylmalonyl-CoA/oxaloacetate decarboxylase gamma subunit
MYSGSFAGLAIQVIQSWQVIVITITLVAFMYLIGYVSRSYRRPRSVSKSKPKKAKAPKEQKTTSPEGSGESSSNDELGLVRN